MRPDRVSDFFKLKKIKGGGQPVSLSSPPPSYYVIQDGFLKSLGTIKTITRPHLRERDGKSVSRYYTYVYQPPLLYVL